MDGRLIIASVFILHILSYGNTVVRGTDENLRDTVLIGGNRKISNFRPETSKVREIVLSERDVDTDVREVILDERIVFKIYQKKSKELNFIWPLEHLEITSNWGGRVDPITGNAESNHNGIDLLAAIGTRVYATESGVVRSARWMKGYGKTVIIDHGDGYSTRFAHLSRYGIEEGDLVGKGDFIARTGNTGRSTGPHLHYEIRYEEKPLNPMEFLEP